YLDCNTARMLTLATAGFLATWLAFTWATSRSFFRATRLLLGWRFSLAWWLSLVTRFSFVAAAATASTTRRKFPAIVPWMFPFLEIPRLRLSLRDHVQRHTVIRRGQLCLCLGKWHKRNRNGSAAVLVNLG